MHEHANGRRAGVGLEEANDAVKPSWMFSVERWLLWQEDMPRTMAVKVVVMNQALMRWMIDAEMVSTVVL